MQNMNRLGKAALLAIILAMVAGMFIAVAAVMRHGRQTQSAECIQTVKGDPMTAVCPARQ